MDKKKANGYTTHSIYYVADVGGGRTYKYLVHIDIENYHYYRYLPVYNDNAADVRQSESRRRIRSRDRTRY